MKVRIPPFLFGCAALLLVTVSDAIAQSPYESSADFARYAEKLRESTLLNVEPQVIVPTSSSYYYGIGGHDMGIYPWKMNIVTTIFWVGELPTQNNPVPNTRSAWDPFWMQDFGGYDNPNESGRNGYIPAAFIPQQNPFYCALPYTDVERGATKPEAAIVIPWYKRTFEKSGRSICRDRWIAIRHGSRVCYAQWEDVGPFSTDSWQYVFGSERPKWNLNQGAGLDVSPAVRDYLGLRGKDVCDWKFVEFREIPRGPWAKWGNNNTFVINARGGSQRVARESDNATRPAASSGVPRVITR